MFQYIDVSVGGTGSGGSGLGMGQGHPSWPLVSNIHLQFDILHFIFLHFDIIYNLTIVYNYNNFNLLLIVMCIGMLEPCTCSWLCMYCNMPLHHNFTVMVMFISIFYTVHDVLVILQF